MAQVIQMAVSKAEIEDEFKTMTVESILPGESFANYFERIGGRTDEANLQILTAMERIRESWSHLPGSVSQIGDTTRLIRQNREDRTKTLMPQ